MHPPPPTRVLCCSPCFVWTWLAPLLHSRRVCVSARWLVCTDSLDSDLTRSSGRFRTAYEYVPVNTFIQAQIPLHSIFFCSHSQPVAGSTPFKMDKNKLLQLDNVLLQLAHQCQVGTLTLTQHHLVFEPSQEGSQEHRVSLLEQSAIHTLPSAL